MRDAIKKGLLYLAIFVMWIIGCWTYFGLVWTP